MNAGIHTGRVEYDLLIDGADQVCVVPAQGSGEALGVLGGGAVAAADAWVGDSEQAADTEPLPGAAVIDAGGCVVTRA